MTTKFLYTAGSVSPRGEITKMIFGLGSILYVRPVDADKCDDVYANDVVVTIHRSIEEVAKMIWGEAL